MSALRHRLARCTPFDVAECPACGVCTCERAEDGGQIMRPGSNVIPLMDSDCPLHGSLSQHPRPPVGCWLGLLRLLWPRLAWWIEEIPNVKTLGSQVKRRGPPESLDYPDDVK